MKFVILLLLIVGLAWWTFGRRKPSSDDAEQPDDGSQVSKKKSAPAGKAKKANQTAETAEPQPMLACVHCGVHLPQADAVLDAQARPFCSEAHRLAGPR